MTAGDQSTAQNLGKEQTQISSLPAKIIASENLTYALVYEGISQKRHQHGEPLIVLIAGVPGSEQDYRYLSPLIYEWAPVVRVVLPGFGVLEDQDNAPASGLAKAQYLKQVADAEQWASLLVVGHSMGGVACIYWAGIDRRVKSLALLCSVGIQAHRGLAFGAWTARFLWLITKLPIIGQYLLQRFRNAMMQMGFSKHKLDAVQLRLILQHVIYLDFKDNKKRLGHEYLAYLDQVGVFWCLDDPIVDINASQALVRHLENSIPTEKLLKRCIEKGGHNPQKHQRLDVNHWLSALYNFYTQRKA